jgi:hypothetical protein
VGLGVRRSREGHRGHTVTDSDSRHSAQLHNPTSHTLLMPAVRRLAATLRQLGGGDSGITPGVAGRSSPGVQAEPPLKLLKDQDVKRWIVDGWLPLSTAGDLPAGLHDTVASKAKAMSTQGLGNNVFPAIPEIGDVLSSPTVRGALTSILGRDYFTHAHRHLHSSGKGDQGWHKDSYWGLRRMRHHRPRWCMILYARAPLPRFWFSAARRLRVSIVWMRLCTSGISPRIQRKTWARLVCSHAASTSPGTTRGRSKARISSISEYPTVA